MVFKREEENISVEEELREWEEEQTLEYLESFFREDLVASKCRYVLFVSESKGRSKGRGRRRRDKPYSRRQRGGQEVELIGYQGHFHLIIDGRGKLDDIATEVLEGTVPKEDTEGELLRRLRNLPRQGQLRSHLRHHLR